MSKKFSIFEGELKYKKDQRRRSVETLGVSGHGDTPNVAKKTKKAMSVTHSKKVLKKYFDKILSGDKTYEVRLADWQCNEGDILELIELNDETRQPTGRSMRRKVGAVIRTKELEKLDWWPEEDVQKYGFQVIALNEEINQ